MILRTLTFKELVRHFENSGTPYQRETMKLLFDALEGHFDNDVERAAELLRIADSYGGIKEMANAINELEDENHKLSEKIRELEHQVRS